MIILRRDVIRVMRDGLERLVADQAAPFLSYLASGIGIHEGSIFRDSITSKGPEQRLELESLVHSAFEDTNLGLGKVKIRQVDFDKASASVSIANCFEAMENGESDEPNCMFTSGFLAGLFAEVLDKTVQAREVKCMSQGQPECEFEITLADAEEQSVDAETIKKEEPQIQSQKTTMLPATEKPQLQSPQTKTPPAPEKPTTSTSPTQKPVEKPSTSVKDQTVQTQKPNTTTNNQRKDGPKPAQSQAELDKGVETANRIEKRKQGFWEKHFKKN
ncbi:MAG TPA: V4R domain-containing protein [Candidatus Bathyarchaeia archaeon]|nr:V4R domain-containing protein [Candidatus Bathyarchaeia archaeon]